MDDRKRVVIDTSVLVSALWSEDGNSAAILKMIPDSIVPVYSEAAFEEYSEVLSRPKFAFSTTKRENLLASIKKFGEAVIPEKSDIPFPDENDRVFYDTAIASAAVLITGNKRDYPDKPFIMTPADFLQKMDVV